MNRPSSCGLTSHEVRRQFRLFWRDRCLLVPAYRNDLPAQRQAFSYFVDELARDGRISERVASNVTMEVA